MWRAQALRNKGSSYDWNKPLFPHLSPFSLDFQHEPHILFNKKEKACENQDYVFSSLEILILVKILNINFYVSKTTFRKLL